MAMEAEIAKSGARWPLVLVGSIGLLPQAIDVLMVPGEFDRNFALSVLAVFGVGLVIAAMAGLYYIRPKPKCLPSVKKVITSPPVVVFLLGTIVVFLTGYVNYSPRAH